MAKRPTLVLWLKFTLLTSFLVVWFPVLHARTFVLSSALNSLFLLIESDVLGLGEFATCLFSCSLFGATVLFDWVCLDVLLVVAEGALLSDNSVKNE
ncbi:hypothetical protein FXO38_36615 [Capsicum annuum]|nr:hypothetical protein FXO38_36615 [Capsicum annuum]KAF3613062.1 hypothetical protein FXO37_36539 [Capsicum annuum]